MSNKISGQLKKLPDAPGVYYFKRGREVLYVGKASSLCDRVRSYFSSTPLGISRLLSSRGPWLAKVIEELNKIDFVKTDSVLEALILEAAEIKKYQPPYNARDKDDKSFNYVVITKEVWPRVLVVRGKELATSQNAKNDRFTPEGPYANHFPHSVSPLDVFGPFPHGGELRTALKIIRKIFPFRDNCTPEIGKSCFNAQIGLCPGVCSGAVSRADYRRTIRHLTLFFEGRKAALLRALEGEMRRAARALHFERAGQLKKQIFALRHIQDVALINNEPRGSITDQRDFRIEAYDAAHLGGGAAVGVMVVIEAGEKQANDYRKFRLRRTKPGDDYGALREVLTRRLRHPEWPFPNLIAIDGGRTQLKIAEKVLIELDLKIPIVAVTKDEHHRPKQIIGQKEFIHSHEAAILLANAEAHRFALAYHRRRQRGQFRQLGGRTSK